MPNSTDIVLAQLKTEEDPNFDNECWYDTENDYVYDHIYSIERAVKGPWEDYLHIVNDPYAVYSDKTFPIKRMLLWYNYRPLVASHDLKIVI